LETPTKEIEEARGRWFASIADKMVGSGSPFKGGREISRNGTKDLPLGMDSLTGYTIISAESLDDAVEIVKDCPMIRYLRVYEAMAMSIQISQSAPGDVLLMQEPCPLPAAELAGWDDPRRRSASRPATTTLSLTNAF
jgi:hypothetical protein